MTMDDELLKKQQARVILNASYYQDTLEEDNVLKTQTLGMNEFRDYDAQNMDAEAASAFREKLKQTMLVDVTAQIAFKDKYADIWEEAKAEQTRLQQDANISGLSKVKNDFLGKKKRAAQKRLDTIDTAQTTLKEKLREEGIATKKKKAAEALEARKKEFEQKIARFAKAGTDSYNDAVADYNARLNAIYDQLELQGEDRKIETAQAKEMITISPLLSDEQKKLAEAHNAEVEQKYNSLYIEQRDLFLKIHPEDSPYYQFLKLGDQRSEASKQTSINAGKYAKALSDKYPQSSLYHTDIHRDAVRWTSPLFKSHLATQKQVEEGYAHMAGIHAVSKKTVDQLPPEELPELKKHMDYGYGRLDEFVKEIEKIKPTLPKSFFGDRPEYEDLLSHVTIITEIYKKSQALCKIGRSMVTSPIYKTLSKDLQDKILNAYIQTAIWNNFTSILEGAGRCYDESHLKDPDAPLARFKTYAQNAEKTEKDLKELLK